MKKIILFSVTIFWINLSNCCEVEKSLTYYDDLLMQGVVFADINLIKFALENKADINSRNHQNNTPLHLAAQYGNYDVALFLLNSKANIDLKNIHKNIPLHLSAMYGFQNITKLLIDARSSSNIHNEFGNQPIHLASFFGHIEVLKLLLEVKCNPNSTAKNNTTPLHHAVEGNQLEAVKFLLKSGAEINAKNQINQTALCFAAMCGHSLIIELLINSAADIDTVDKSRFSPFIYSVMKNNVQAVKMFLKVKVSTKDVIFLTNLDMIVKPILKLFMEYGVKFAIDYSAEYKKLLGMDEQNKDILRAAAFDKNSIVTSLLKLKRADLSQLNAKDATGTTPIMWAAARGNSEIIKALLDYRKENKIVIDLLEANSLGENAIDLAVEHNHLGSLMRLRQSTYDQAKVTISVALSALISMSVEESLVRTKCDKPYNPSLFVIIISQYLAGQSDKACAYCQAPEPEKNCKCKKAKYCSEECYKAHWKDHKEEHNKKDDDE